MRPDTALTRLKTGAAGAILGNELTAVSRFYHVNLGITHETGTNIAI